MIRSTKSAIHEFLDSTKALDWTAQGRLTALKQLITSAIKVGETQVIYYEDVRNKQQMWAQTFRIGMVGFGGAGFVFPLLSRWIAHAPEIGYVCLAIAAICITANNVFASANNQSRFLLSQFKLEKLLSEFRLSVAQAEVSWTDATISEKQLFEAIGLIKMFLSDVFDSVINETGEWSKDVRDAIDVLSRKIDNFRGG